MSWSFSHLIKGSTPTFLEASFANKVIDALNVLGNITIMPDTEDGVQYTDSGVYIYYKNPAGDITQTIKAINPDDITSMVTIEINEGMITSVETGSSGYSLKTLEVCEDGASATYDFVIKDS